jgi:CBS domain containing-hemolysin-like protein
MLLTIPTLILVGILIMVVGGLCLAALLLVAARARARREEVAEANDPSIPEGK